MKQEEVFTLAREAGGVNCDCCLPEPEPHEMQEFLIRFAALIEAKVKADVMAGAGEPVAHLQPKCVDSFMRADLGYETCASSDYGSFSVYTADQLAGAVLREREVVEQQIAVVLRQHGLALALMRVSGGYEEVSQHGGLARVNVSTVYEAVRLERITTQGGNTT